MFRKRWSSRLGRPAHGSARRRRQSAKTAGPVRSRSVGKMPLFFPFIFFIFSLGFVGTRHADGPVCSRLRLGTCLPILPFFPFLFSPSVWLCCWKGTQRPIGIITTITIININITVTVPHTLPRPRLLTFCLNLIYFFFFFFFFVFLF